MGLVQRHRREAQTGQASQELQQLAGRALVGNHVIPGVQRESLAIRWNDLDDKIGVSQLS